MDIVFFHLPEEENGYLSNWYPSDFSIRDIEFSSMEQFLMYSKALLFKDTDVAQQIMQTHNPAEIKKLGREVKGFKEPIWAANRFQICIEGLRAKFCQNKELQERLLRTSGRFAECTAHDYVWGIGCSMNDPNRLVCSNWNGMNLLGIALEQVYNELVGGKHYA